MHSITTRLSIHYSLHIAHNNNKSLKCFIYFLLLSSTWTGPGPLQYAHNDSGPDIATPLHAMFSALMGTQKDEK
jgi:hypothetical protein